MLLPQINLMEDELEEGEIIEVPLLATPTNYKIEARDSDIKNAKPSNHLPNFRYEKRLNSCKTHVCKSRKKNVKKRGSKDGPVRVVKYKVKPNDFKSTRVRENASSTSKLQSKHGKLSSVNNKSSASKRRSYPKQYRDLFEHSDYEVDDPSYEDLLTQYKALQSKLKVLREDTKNEKELMPKMSPLTSKSLKRKVSKSPEEPKVLGDKSKSSPLKKPKIETIEIVDDEEEDNEDDLDFLRQLALASRSKPSSSDVVQCNGDGIDNLNEDLSPFHSGADNYEVVDMEFSDTDDIDQEILNEQDLNTLTNSILQENVNDDYKVEASLSDSGSDDDDEDLLMLRAKLLEEMKEKQKLNRAVNNNIPNALSVISEADNSQSQDVGTSVADIDSSANTAVPEKETFNNDLLTCKATVVELNDPSSCEGFKLESNEIMLNANHFDVETFEQGTHDSNPVDSNVGLSQCSALDESISVGTSQQKEISHVFNGELFKTMDKENVVKQGSDSHLSNNESLLVKRNPVRKKPFNYSVHRELVKPLVIKLGESSESESENEINENESGNDVLASLEKLIENAKNNVDDRAEEEAKEIAAILHGNEEYNIYSVEDAKLEAKKKKQQMAIYNNLLSSLRSACSTYKDDEQLYLTVRKQAIDRKVDFVAAQVEMEHLQEMLRTALKVKNNSKKSMYAANGRLAAILQALNKKRGFIALLRKNCIKIGTQIFGLNYTLPNFEAQSRFRLRQRNS